MHVSDMSQNRVQMGLPVDMSMAVLPLLGLYFNQAVLYTLNLRCCTCEGLLKLPSGVEASIAKGH